MQSQREKPGDVTNQGMQGLRPAKNPQNKMALLAMKQQPRKGRWERTPRKAIPDSSGPV